MQILVNGLAVRCLKGQLKVPLFREVVNEAGFWPCLFSIGFA